MSSVSERNFKALNQEAKRVRAEVSDLSARLKNLEMMFAQERQTNASLRGQIAQMANGSGPTQAGV